MLTRRLPPLTLAFSLLVAAPAGAQGSPSVVPASFVLEEGEPSPCFEFACYRGSVLDRQTLVAIGAQLASAYVWVRDSAGTWSQQAVLAHPDPNASWRDSTFAAALALDGDDLVLSAGELGGWLVFRRSGTTWSYRQTLPGTAGTLDLKNGILVATDTSGSFVVYEKGAGGLFRKRATLRLPRFIDGYLSGPVELDANTAVIAGGDDTDGAVFIFQRLLGVWLFAQKLSAPPAAAGGGFGTALAIDHDRIAVGAPDVPGLDPDRPGVVQTYARRGLQWRAGQLLVNPVPPDGNHRSFGTVVDIEGRRLLASAGAPYYPYAPYLPSAYLFALDGNQWTLAAALDAGPAVALELSGNVALVDADRLRYGSTPIVFDLP